MSVSYLLHMLACGLGGQPVAESLVVSLVVAPAEVTVTSTPDAPGTARFVATATFDDGTEAPLDLVSWALSNQSAGEIGAEGVFIASAENGGLATVTATHNGITASADLTVVFASVLDETGGAVEDEAFDGTPGPSITWLYPPDGVAVPRNIPSLTFMWSEVSGADAYRLTFTTPTTSVTVLTTEHRWTAQADDWTTIAATNAGGQVTVEVRALVGGALHGSEARSVTVNRLDAQGSIYYWSTSDTGIIKVPISAEEPELYYTPRTGAPTCVACHVVREDRMAVTYGSNDGKFYAGITDLTSGAPEELTERDEYGYYNTMNPEGTRMISSSSTGVLNLWDAEAGELIGPLDAGGVKLTQPDWSADGSFLVAIRADDLRAVDHNFQEGKIVVATIDDDGNLGPLTEVFDPMTTWGRADYGTPNVFYPSISPDGEWIAFNYGDSLSYDNETASLWVIAVDGGDPIELVNANQGEDLGNSWPHWGPLPDDDVYWLTFSSKRDYGDLVTDGRPQIWVSSFDPALAGAGGDPSSAAFWLPNQDIDTNNHTTYWGP